MMNTAVAISMLMIFALGTDGLRRQGQPVVSQNKFFCNVKALTPTERARHKELTAKLLVERKESVETQTGYEFQFNPKNVSLMELADWVAAESKCCSFLDFHIDVEAEGNLLCLRLTGAQGVKDFIRSEFSVKNGR
jgi:hypothetical protein